MNKTKNSCYNGRMLASCVLMNLLSPAAHAHGFGQFYTLPVPVWLYLYGAAAALVLSFLIVAYFVNSRSVELNLKQWDLSQSWIFRLISHPLSIACARFVSVFILALTIATGFFGSQNSYANFSMTMFWILFVLGYAYFIMLVGDTYSSLNPWHVICQWTDRVFPKAFSGHFHYPRTLGYWPAVGLYMGFIWFELFGKSKPLSLAMALSGYTLLNVIAAFVFGRKAWFQYGEFFSVLFRTLGLMAPFKSSIDPDSGRHQLYLRHPFIGLTMVSASQWSLLIFVLFMLSSTAFDGLKSTEPFVSVYWKSLSPYIVSLLGGDIIEATPILRAMYPFWQTITLVLSPFFYLGVYLLYILLTKLLVQSNISVAQMSLHFTYSLVPIAFVYHVTHYYTLMLSQGAQILQLVSDPFGVGWNLFGTADWQIDLTLEAGTIWHTQVWLILFGHIVSVYLAHYESLKLFGSSKRAALSQIPMLMLMVALTTIGLWILSLPISPGA